MSAARSSERVLADALSLTEEQRVRLAADILRSVEGPPDALDDDAWVAELRRRAERVLRGESNGSPWTEVRDDLLANLRR